MNIYREMKFNGSLKVLQTAVAHTKEAEVDEMETNSERKLYCFLKEL